MSDTDRPADRERLARRWAAVSAERDRLLAISRRRSLNRQDAEDCVQEALLRSVEFDGLDEDRVAPFLTTVTVRLCADQHRARQRQDKLDRRMAAWRVEEPSPEEAACDRDEAAWLAGSLRGMPARQQQVIQARMEGLSDSEIAERLGVSYSSVASALARARSAVRMTLAAGAAWLFALLRRPRAAAMTAATAAAMAVAITTTSPVVKAPVPVALPAVPAPRMLEVTPVAQPVQPPAPVRVAPPRRPAPAPAPGEVAPSRQTRVRPVAAAAAGGPVDVEEKDNGRTFQEEIQNCLDNGVQINVPGETACRESSAHSPE